MALSKTYTKSPCALDSMVQQIVDSPDVVLALDHEGTSLFGDQLTIAFKADLADWTDVDALVAAHDGTPLPQNVIPKVQPTSVYNEHLLVPYGMTKAKVQHDQYCASITLSNQNGDTFNYTCSLTPVAAGYIIQDDVMVRVEIESVDTQAGTLTVKEGGGDLINVNDPTLVSNPYISECTMPTQVTVETQPLAISVIYLWGLTFKARNFGDDDFICLKVMMPTEQGLVEISEYEETWTSNVDAVGRISTPDGAPGEVPAGLVMRMEYHPTLTTSQVTHVNYDFILTVKP